MRAYDDHQSIPLAESTTRVSNRQTRSTRNALRSKHRSRTGLILGGIVLASALIVVMPRVFSMTLTPAKTEYVHVTVAPGQTLWQIAAEHKAPRSDTRSMVYNIRTVNELSDASVYPGQVLRVPVGRR